MKKLLWRILVIVYSVMSCAHVFAGGLSTSGQGSRALGMAGAFTAVADDGTAIYYNPAGIIQMEGTDVMAGAVYGWPEIKYKMPNGATQKSTKNFLGPWIFANHSFTDRLSAGLGIYSPYARDAEFGEDIANGFLSQRAKIVRIDISPVLAYRINEYFSIGGGLIIGYSDIDQSIPASPVLRIKDELDGWGIGGIGGVLIIPNEYLRLGLTYRTRMKTDYDGKRQMVSPGLVLEDDAEIDGKWPSSLGAGIAVFPIEKLKIALDVNWTEWSYVDKVVTKTKNLGDSTTTLDQDDTWDFRVGGEWEFKPTWFLRGGYAFTQQAVPSKWIIPAKPDGDGHSIDVSVGKDWEHWKIDVLYEYIFTDTVEAADNAYGFTGDYSIKQHALALTAAYKF